MMSSKLNRRRGVNVIALVEWMINLFSLFMWGAACVVAIIVMLGKAVVEKVKGE
jgi:hypothetical protein